VDLTCSKMRTKNKLMSMIGPVQSHKDVMMIMMMSLLINCDYTIKCCCSAETSDEYKGLVVARSLVINLLHFVNDEVREQENWRKTLHIYSRLDKRPIESSTHPVLVELRVSGTVLYAALFAEDHITYCTSLSVCLSCLSLHLA